MRIAIKHLFDDVDFNLESKKMINSYIENDDLKNFITARKIELSDQHSSNDDVSSLFKACSSHSFQIVEYLIEQGVSVEACDPILHEPLISRYVYDNSLELLKILCDALKEPAQYLESCGATVFEKAIRHSQVKVVKLLLSYGVDQNKVISSPSPLWWAARANNLEIVKLLCEASLPPDGKIGRTKRAISPAAEHGNMDMVRYLVEDFKISLKALSFYGEHTYHRPPLSEAIEKGHTDVAIYLIENGAPVAYPKTIKFSIEQPSIYAARSGCLEILKMINDDGGVINIGTCMHIAEQNNDEDMVEYLYEIL